MEKKAVRRYWNKHTAGKILAITQSSSMSGYGKEVCLKYGIQMIRLIYNEHC